MNSSPINDRYKFAISLKDLACLDTASFGKANMELLKDKTIDRNFQACTKGARDEIASAFDGYSLKIQNALQVHSFNTSSLKVCVLSRAKDHHKMAYLRISASPISNPEIEINLNNLPLILRAEDESFLKPFHRDGHSLYFTQLRLDHSYTFESLNG